nr:hypothetical protein [uncultured Rhodopila sp.]
MTTSAIALAGLATPPIFGLFAARLILRRRRTSFALNKTKLAVPAFAQINLPPIATPPQQLILRDAFKAIAETEHATAKRLQNACIFHLIVASSALLVAFVAIALGSTLLVQEDAWHTYVDATDVAALIIVLFGFSRTRTLRRDWLRARIVTEMLRQWGVIDGVLARSPNGFTVQIEQFLASVRASVLASRDPLQAGQALVESRCLELKAILDSTSALTASFLRLYLQARVVRQTEWLGRSIARIENQKGDRERLTVGLFAIALCAALLKFAMSSGIVGAADWIGQSAELVFLLATGVAAASTSSYLGHNFRSVLHRYRAQYRFFEDWFRDYQDVIAAAQHDHSFNAPLTARGVEAVLSFESLMMNELVDWLAISMADGMDLGLS